MSTPCFVFGSNLAGRHGRGAAKTALDSWGAVYGYGRGLAGNSYAIPTKDTSLQTLPLNTIKEYVEEFISFANTDPDTLFILTPIGCGLAGYEPWQIAPMFEHAPLNVYLPKQFIPYLQPKVFE